MNTYSFSVTVHETKGVRILDTAHASTVNQFVVISCGNDALTSNTRYDASNTIFDFTASFSVECSEDDLAFQMIDVALYSSLTINSYLIGRLVVNPATIWEVYQGRVRQRWLSLTPACGEGSGSTISNTDSGCVGSICISANVQLAKRLSELTNYDMSAGGLETDIITIKYFCVTIQLHRAQDVLTTLLLGAPVRAPSIEIRFHEYVIKTGVKNNDHNPDFNIEVQVPHCEPSLDTFIRIVLYNGDTNPIELARTAIPISKLVPEQKSVATWINLYTNRDMSAKDNVRAVANMALSAILPQDQNQTRSATSSWTSGWAASVGSALGVNVNQNMYFMYPQNRPSYSTLRSQAELYDPQQSNTNFATTYCGRLLLSCYIKKSATQCSITLAPSIPPSLPNTHTVSLLFTIVEILYPRTFDVSQGSLEICVGPYNVETTRLTGQTNFTMKPLNFQIENLQSMWNILFKIKQSGVAVGYYSLTGENMLSYVGSPNWIKCVGTSSSGMGFKILTEIGLDGDIKDIIPAALIAKIDRKAHRDYEVQDHIFRCFIYEASNLTGSVTTTDLNGTEVFMPNPYVMVEFTGKCMIGSCIELCNNPQYYQSFQSVVSLPSDVELRDDIGITVYSKSAKNSNDDIIGQARFSVHLIPYQWSDEPARIALTRSETGEQRSCGSLLISFELIPQVLVQRYPFFDDIRPTTFEANVSFNIRSIILYSRSIRTMKVSVSYGRNVKNSRDPLWQIYLKAPTNVYGTLLYYRDLIQVIPELPKRLFHYSYLEVTVESDLGILFGIIPLTPCLPWHSVEQQLKAKQDFKLVHEESYLIDAVKSRAASTNSKNHEMKRRSAEVIEDEVLIPDTTFITKAVSENVCIYLPGDSAFGALYEFGLIKNVGESCATICGYSCDALKFNLESKDEELLYADELKEVINFPLEFILEDALLDHYNVFLYEPIKGSNPRIAGRIRYNLSVNNIEYHPPVSQQKMEPTEIDIRLYILNFADLGTLSQASRNTFYLKITRLGTIPQSELSGVSQDSVFNRVYRYVVELPATSIIQVDLYKKDDTGDELVGTTYFDLLLRWDHPQYHALLEADTIPIETRFMYAPGYPAARASCRCWLEMYDLNSNINRPISELSSPGPKPYELRICVYHISDVPATEILHLQVGIRLRLDQDSEDEQLSDVHYNSNDGSGLYNWRFVYTCKIPTRFTMLMFKIYTVNFMGSITTAMAEGVYDLSSDFEIAMRKKANDAVENTQRTIQCYNKDEDPHGSIVWSMSIVSQHTAKLKPVGLGRAEPNRSPHLENVLTNRSYFSWEDFTVSLQDLGSSLLRSTRNTLIIGGVIGLLGFILFIVLLSVT